MIQPFIVSFKCLFAQPWSAGLCTPLDFYGILISTKSRFRRLGLRQIPSLGGSLKASRRLSGGCGAGRESRKGPAKD